MNGQPSRVSDQASGKRPSQWWRWPLVLPVSIAAYLLIVFPIAKITELPFLSATTQDVLSQIVHGLLSPWAFVYAGAKVAPRGRFITSLTLILIYTVVCTTVLVAALTKWGATARFWYTLATSVAGLIVAAGAVYGFHRDEHQQSAVMELFE